MPFDKIQNLPFAGITQIRFKGYDLSLPAPLNVC